MRVLGLDYGAKTVGVAVSDALGISAQPVETIFRERETHLRRTMKRLEELAEEYKIEQVVVGWPIHLDGGISESAVKAQQFAEKVKERLGCPVELWDERVSTAFAEKALIEQQVRREHRKEYVYQIAAVFILQGYLDYQHNQENQDE